jgi:hypothetical protein
MEPVSQFIILVTLHVLVSLDHHQVCMNKNNKCTMFMQNYMTKINSFFNIIKLKVVYILVLNIQKYIAMS